MKKKKKFIGHIIPLIGNHRLFRFPNKTYMIIDGSECPLVLNRVDYDSNIVLKPEGKYLSVSEGVLVIGQKEFSLLLFSPDTKGFTNYVLEPSPEFIKELEIQEIFPRSSSISCKETTTLFEWVV